MYYLILVSLLSAAAVNPSRAVPFCLSPRSQIEENKLPFSQNLDRLFERLLVQNPEIVQHIVPLRVGRRKVHYSSDPSSYINYLRRPEIEDSALAEGFAQIGEKKINGGTIKIFLVRGAHQDNFVIFTKDDREVIDVALPIQGSDKAFSFIIVDDPQLRKVMQRKLIDQKKRHPYSPWRSDFDLGGEALVMSGFLTHEEVSQAKNEILKDPLLSHLFKWVHDRCPGVVLRDFITIQVPEPVGGWYSPKTKWVAKTLNGPFNGAIYTHELAHHIFEFLHTEYNRYMQSLAASFGHTMTQEGMVYVVDPQIVFEKGSPAALFSQMISHFREETHHRLFHWLRNHELYKKRVENDTIYLKNETFAYIVETAVGREIRHMASGYRITYRDIQLLTALEILPPEIYGSQELFEGVKDLDQPIPEGFFHVAEAYHETGSLSEGLHRLFLERTDNGMIEWRTGILTELADWFIGMKRFKELDHLLKWFDGQNYFVPNFPYKGERLAVRFVLYHYWPEADRSAEIDAADLLLYHFRGEIPEKSTKLRDYTNALEDHLKNLISRVRLYEYLEAPRTREQLRRISSAALVSWALGRREEFSQLLERWYTLSYGPFTEENNDRPKDTTITNDQKQARLGALVNGRPLRNGRSRHPFSRFSTLAPDRIQADL